MKVKLHLAALGILAGILGTACTGIDTYTDNEQMVIDTASPTDDRNRADTDTPTETPLAEYAMEDTETATDSDVQTCVEKHISFPLYCDDDCVDGGWYDVYVEEAEMPDIDIWMNDPSQEALAAAFAWYDAYGCGRCGKWYKLKNEQDEWVETTVTAFCRTIVEAQRACDNCIAIGTPFGTEDF